MALRVNTDTLITIPVEVKIDDILNLMKDVHEAVMYWSHDDDGYHLSRIDSLDVNDLVRGLTKLSNSGRKGYFADFLRRDYHWDLIDEVVQYAIFGHIKYS